MCDLVRVSDVTTKPDNKSSAEAFLTKLNCHELFNGPFTLPQHLRRLVEVTPVCGQRGGHMTRHGVTLISTLIVRVACATALPAAQLSGEEGRTALSGRGVLNRDLSQAPSF